MNQHLLFSSPSSSFLPRYFVDLFMPTTAGDGHPPGSVIGEVFAVVVPQIQFQIRREKQLVSDDGGPPVVDWKNL